MNRSESWAWFATLLITCLLGVGLGLSLGYALFGYEEGTLERSSASASDSGPATSPQNTSPAVDDPDATLDAILAAEAALREQATSRDGTQTAARDASANPARAEEAPAPSEPEEDVWAARHLFIAVNGQWLAEGSKKFLKDLKPGGVVLRTSNLQSESQTAELVKEIKLAVGFGGGLGDLPLIAVQEESGPNNRLGLSDAPSAQELGRSGDGALARNLGLRYAQACMIRGIGVTLSPVLDVYESGTIDPGLEIRSFGSDQTVVANIGLAMVDGLREGGVVPVVKHFPGYGASTYASDGMLVVLNKDFSGLARVMYPFNEAVRRDVQGIVVGYVAVPALDKEDPRRPAALSPILVTDLLRNRWGFDGVILADDVVLNEFRHARPIERTAVEALAAGCDAIMLLDANPERIKLVCSAIEEAVRTGELTREALDKSKERLSRWQELLRKTPAGKPAAQATLRPPVASSAAPEQKIPEPVHIENATASQAPIEEERTVVAKVPAIEFVAAEPKERAPAEFAAPDLEEDTTLEADSPAREALEDDGARSDQSASPVEAQAHDDPDSEPDASIEEKAQAESDASENTETLEFADAPAEEQSVEIEAIDSPSQGAGDTESESRPATDEAVVAKAQVARAETVSSEIGGVPANDTDTLPGIATEDAESELDAGPPPSADAIEAKVIVVADAPAVSRRSATQNRDGVEHTVQENELLSQISRIYGVSAADIVKWNNLRQAKLETGTKLMIYFGPEPLPEEDASGSDLTKLTFKLVHTVEPEETLSALAKQYSVSMDDLKLWNGLESEELQADQILTIFVGAQRKPSDDVLELKTGEYEVQAGDTLNKIAQEFFTTRKLLLQLNKLKDPDHIFVGQKLKVPLGVKSASSVR